MDNFLNKGAIVPKYPPKNWTAKKATAYGYEFTQDATSTTIADIADKETFVGDKIIPDSIENKPVIRIGNYAFQSCTGLTNITIPSSVMSIGDSTFSGCKGLTRISIPSSVTSIGKYAFGNCTGLTNITIPSSVTSIGDNAFYGCIGLTNINIPGSVTRLGYRPFEYCSGLTNITSNSPNYRVEGQRYLIQNSNNSLIAFAQKDATSAVIPSSVTSIENGTFGRCTELISINIPSSVTSIGSEAFYYCTELTSINIAKPTNSLDGAPWFASKATVNWGYKG